MGSARFQIAPRFRHSREAVSTAYFFDALGERSFFFIVLGFRPFYAHAILRMALAILFSFGSKARTLVVRLSLLLYLHDAEDCCFFFDIPPVIGSLLTAIRTWTL